jgi:2,6-dihydroxypseudooxynicotine hydrolase
MSPEVIDYATYNHRFLAEGVTYRDLVDIRETVTDIEQWAPTWSKFAREAEERAERAKRAGATLTAGTELTRASIYYFFAQFLLWQDPVAKRAAYDSCARTFAEGAPLLDPPFERLEIPFEDITLPAYLRLPRGVTRPPIVVLLNGLDTTKEEQLVISTHCVQRGLATLSFDGPGSGETYPRRKLTPENDRAVHAVLDFLERRRDIDPARLGLIGRSLGGHFAPKVAANDKRVKAVVAWGAMYHLRNYATIPDNTRNIFVHATGSRTVEEARPFFDGISLEGVASRITCPLMIVHGGRDPITPTDNATRLAAEAKGPVEMLFWEDGLHCAHDRPHICRPAMADFMLRQL